MTEDITALSSAELCPSPKPEKKQEAPHVDEVAVEEVRLEHINRPMYFGFDYFDNYYSLKIKIRNNYEPAPGQEPLAYISVRLQLLDADKDVLPTEMDHADIENPDPGQGGWTSVSMRPDGIEAAKYLRIGKYEIASQSAESRWRYDGIFSEPPTYEIAGLLGGSAAGVKNPTKTLSIENVRVAFADSLPAVVTESSAFRSSGNPDKGKLNNSEIFAEIHFSATNLAKNVFALTDSSADFAVELDFDNGFLFNSGTGKDVYFLCGNKVDLAGPGFRALTDGGIRIAPLVTEDLVVYMTVAKAVSTQTDKPLKLSFLIGKTDVERHEFQIR